MFRKAIAAVAALSFFVGCAHSSRTEDLDDETRPQDPYASTYTAPPSQPVKARAAPKPKPAVVNEDDATARREPDNTGINKRDTDDQTLTPLDQSNSGNDLTITQNIRKAVVGADGLSFTAKNVKIITRDATVTLRGPVKTSTEKQRIDALARACAGVARVDNQLEVEATN